MSKSKWTLTKEKGPCKKEEETTSTRQNGRTWRKPVVAINPPSSSSLLQTNHNPFQASSRRRRYQRRSHGAVVQRRRRYQRQSLGDLVKQEWRKEQNAVSQAKNQHCHTFDRPRTNQWAMSMDDIREGDIVTFCQKERGNASPPSELESRRVFSPGRTKIC